jgi:ABC-type multidrug transport system fused ATPase/permease subunit
VQVIVQALILAYGSYLYWQRELELEQLLAFLLYRAQLQEWTGKLLDSFSNLLKSSGAARQVFVLLERKPRHCQPTEARVTPRGSARGEVSFQAVHFAYPTRPDASVLHGLSFDVQPGQLLALTGPSGAGKSTCFHLLEHFYEPSAGRVLLDGFDVSHLDHKWLHRNVGLVGQEPVLFSGAARCGSSIGWLLTY